MLVRVSDDFWINPKNIRCIKVPRADGQGPRIIIMHDVLEVIGFGTFSEAFKTAERIAERCNMVVSDD